MKLSPYVALFVLGLGVNNGVADEGATAAPNACFPACRQDFVCNAETRTCVSECNPPCEGGAVCTRGQCMVSDTTQKSVVEPREPRLTVRAGYSNQVNVSMSSNPSASGVRVEAPFRMHKALFVAPRFQAFFPNSGTALVELGLELGLLQYTQLDDRFALGIEFGFSGMYWVDSGFYGGANVAPRIRFFGWSLGIPFELGAETGSADIYITVGFDVGYSL